MCVLRLISLLALLSATAHAEPKTVHLLTVGNSFANNALTYLPKFAEESGHTLVVGRANLGGCTLGRHWRHATRFEENPASPDGRPYGSGGTKRSLAQLLESKPWDMVTIQHVSIKSHDPATYRPYAEKLHAYIREHAPQAEILLHQVWAYRLDDPRFTPANEGAEPHTQKLMFEQVRAANHEVARGLGIAIIPSGDAMFAADTDPRWGYRPDNNFDFESATPPLLPDQSRSLHVGCLWFKNIFAAPLNTLTYLPKDVDPAHATFLRQVARHTPTPVLAG